MAWRIVKQPNGLLGRFSDIIDNFTHINMDYDEAIQCCLDNGISNYEAAKVKVDAGVNDYKPWTRNEIGSGLDRWDDCIATIRNVHSESGVKRILTFIYKEEE